MSEALANARMDQDLVWRFVPCYGGSDALLAQSAGRTEGMI